MGSKSFLYHIFVKGEWNYYVHNFEFSRQKFLLNYGVRAAVPVLGNDTAVIINCD